MVQEDSLSCFALNAMGCLRSVNCVGGHRASAAVEGRSDKRPVLPILEIIMNARYATTGRNATVNGKTKPSGIWPSGSFPDVSR